MNTKAYFSPYLFTFFFDCFESTEIIDRCKRWEPFLIAHGIEFPAGCWDTIEVEIKDKILNAQGRQHLVLNIPSSEVNTPLRFAFHFFGGLLPSCQCGFVDGNVKSETSIIPEILQPKLADVIDLPAFGNNDDVEKTGAAWALYLDLKLNSERSWRHWHWSNFSAPSGIAKTSLIALADEIGTKTMSFIYPTDIKAMNEWLGKCDLQLTPRTTATLEGLLSYAKISGKEWRKLRWR